MKVHILVKHSEFGKVTKQDVGYQATQTQWQQMTQIMHSNVLIFC